jgi:putative transposase
VRSPAVRKAWLATVLGVSRGSLYYTLRMPGKDQRLKAAIEAYWRSVDPAYGYRRLAPTLHVGERRIRRVLKQFQLKPYRRRGQRQFAGRSAPPLLPNLYRLVRPNRPSQVWVADFTAFWYKTRWVFLATVLDAWTREVVGWSVQGTHSLPLVFDALFAALNHRPRPAIFHSDNGSEYASRAFVGTLRQFGITPSRSSPSSPWQNGQQESFYSQLKVDLGDPGRFRTLGELVAAIHWQVHRYNRQRLHTVLKTTPHAFAQRFSTQT